MDPARLAEIEAEPDTEWWGRCKEIRDELIAALKQAWRERDEWRSKWDHARRGYEKTKAEVERLWKRVRVSGDAPVLESGPVLEVPSSDDPSTLSRLHAVCEAAKEVIRFVESKEKRFIPSFIPSIMKLRRAIHSLQDPAR